MAATIMTYMAASLEAIAKTAETEKSVLVVNEQVTAVTSKPAVARSIHVGLAHPTVSAMATASSAPCATETAVVFVSVGL